jgi:hypothetical protein
MRPTNPCHGFVLQGIIMAKLSCWTCCCHYCCCCFRQVLLSVPVTSVQGFLLNAVGFVVLSMVLAAAVCLAVGLLVAPSLATDEVS